MSVSKAVIAKKINGSVEYIYPKTTSDIVEYTANKSVQTKLQELDNAINNNTVLETRLSDIESRIGALEPSMIPVSSISDMTDLDAIYILTTDNKWYYYDETEEEWISGGTIAGLNVDATLTQQGSAADAKAVGDKILKMQIVEQLPVIGVANTIYLIAKDGSTRFDKFWWVTNTNTNTSGWDRFGESTTLVVNTLPPTGDSDVDYIVKSSAGCLYYKYINNTWNLVAGSIATVTDELPAIGNEFTDYYVPDLYGNFTHYRWYNNTFHLVGCDPSTKADGVRVDGNYFYLTSNGEDIAGPFGPFAGGTGSGGSASISNSATMTARNNTYINGAKATAFTRAEGAPCNVSFIWKSVDEDGEFTGAGSITVSVSSGENANARNATVKGYINNVKQDGLEDDGYTNISIDISKYCSQSEKNIVVLAISDVYGNTKSIIYTITYISISLTSNFNNTNIFTGDIQFTYAAIGPGAKTMHFLLDGVESSENPVISTTNQVNEIVLRPSASSNIPVHGAHTIVAYFTCTINNETVESNRLTYEIIYAESGNNTPIIVSSFNETSVKQYSSVSIKYLTYNTNSVDITVNNGAVTTATGLENNVWNTFSYKAENAGTNTVVIKAGSVTKTITFTVEETDIQVTAVTGSLALYLDSVGRNNNDANKEVWSYTNSAGNTITARLNDFDFISNGWVLDDENTSVLRISNGARLVIPYDPFGELKDNKLNGLTIEVDFATSNVTNYNSQIFSCIKNGIGLDFTAQSATFKSKALTLETKYKENERMRLTYVIEKSSSNTFIYTYINGVMSSINIYSTNDSFNHQGNDVDITVGSNDCTVDLYSIRVYTTDLNRNQVLDNWIADTRSESLKEERYKRNNILNQTENIDILKVASNLLIPYIVIKSNILPLAKSETKNAYGLGTSDVIADVKYFDPLDDKRNFYIQNATIAVQGTSSQKYPVKNYKIKAKNYASKGGPTCLGFTITTDPNNPPGEITDENTIKKYPLRGDPKAENLESVPVNTFCVKADYASSEGVNNVELVRLYETLCPYKTPPQRAKGGSKIRQGIDGFPILIFQELTNENGETTEIKFIGKYNFNNDKGTEEVYGLTEGDESWENKINGAQLSSFKSSDFTYTWTDDKGKVHDWHDQFEARYPEDNEDITNLSNFVAWVNSTDPDQATGNALSESYVVGSTTYTNDTAEYRLAKFKNELDDHLQKDAVIFYYLFTEIFLMVDSREKNMFSTFYHEDNKNGNPLWFSLPYDFDTANGIDNEGRPVFNYDREDHGERGKFNGADVYNGQTSVLWNNIRKTCNTEITTLYQSFRNVEEKNAILSFKYVNNLFRSHQLKWGERVFNEDAYYKYIVPAISVMQRINSGDTSVSSDDIYLDMLRGDKFAHRQWWLYNRFAYLDSKYGAATNAITFRAYANGNSLSITPYSNTYMTIKMAEITFPSADVINAGDVYTFDTSPVIIDPDHDTDFSIFSADKIINIDNILNYNPDNVKISAAVNLQSLILGSDNGNTYLKALDTDNNRALKVLNVRNCVNLKGATQTTTLKLSGCSIIEEIYAQNTSIGEITLPETNTLKKFYIPSSIVILIMYNQNSVTNFAIDDNDYSNISKCYLSFNPNSASASIINTKTIFNGINSNANIFINNIDWEFDDRAEVDAFYDRLIGMGGVARSIDNTGKVTYNDTAYPFISGKIKINNLTSNAELQSIISKFNSGYTVVNSGVSINKLANVNIEFSADTTKYKMKSEPLAVTYNGDEYELAVSYSSDSSNYDDIINVTVPSGNYQS